MPLYTHSSFRFTLALVLAIAVPIVFSAYPSRGQSVATQVSAPLVMARTLRNGLGVSGQPGVDASVVIYAAMLEQLHIRNLRSAIMGGGVSQARHWGELRLVMQRNSVGSPQLHFTALVGAYLNDPATTWPVQRAALLDVASTGLLFAIEGPNEINNPFVGGGSHAPQDAMVKTRANDVAANYLAWARAIHDLKQANAALLRGVMLVAPSIASGLPTDYARLPDVSAFVDAGNIHFYAGGGRQPDLSQPINPDVGSFDAIYQWGRQSEMPHGRLWLTEAGASTSVSNAASGVSQAKYLANQIFDYFAAGGTHLFIYNLIDPKKRAGNVEDGFGLFSADASPKPAVSMLAALQDLVSLNNYNDARNARDGALFTLGYDPAELKLSWSSTPGAPSPRALVIAKSDGSTILAVWNEAAMNDGHGHELHPPPQQVTLDFGRLVNVNVHDLLGASPRVGMTPSGARFESRQLLTLELRDYPLLVELSPSN